MPRKKQPTRRRHVPQRTCVACRRVDNKRELIRIVRSKEHGVQVDPTGKASGRGAYLCPVRDCWDKALKGSLLARALKTPITEEEMAALREFAATLPYQQEQQLVLADQ